MSSHFHTYNQAYAHIARFWGLSCAADTLGSWAATYELIRFYNKDEARFSDNQIETLDWLQSIAFLRYAEIEKAQQ